MIFTIPALFIFGFDPQLLEMIMWGGIGGLLGVLFMVPLRRVSRSELPHIESPRGNR